MPPLSPPPPCSNNADTRNKQGALAIICHYRASDRSKRARFQVYSLDLAIYKILRVTPHACISHMRMRMTFSRHANYVCPPRYKQLGTALLIFDIQLIAFKRCALWIKHTIIMQSSSVKKAPDRLIIYLARLLGHTHEPVYIYYIYTVKCYYAVQCSIYIPIIFENII